MHAPCYSAETRLSKAHHRNKALLSSKEEKQKDQKEQLESDLFDLLFLFSVIRQLPIKYIDNKLSIIIIIVIKIFYLLISSMHNKQR